MSCVVHVTMYLTSCMHAGWVLRGRGHDVATRACVRHDLALLAGDAYVMVVVLVAGRCVVMMVLCEDDGLV